MSWVPPDLQKDQEINAILEVCPCYQCEGFDREMDDLREMGPAAAQFVITMEAHREQLAQVRHALLEMSVLAASRVGAQPSLPLDNTHPKVKERRTQRFASAIEYKILRAKLSTR